MQATPRTYSPLIDAAIVELKKAKWKNSAIAEVLGVSAIALEHHITRQRRRGLKGPFRDRPANYVRQLPSDVPVVGETWTDVPFRMLSISSAERVASMKSGYLISPFKRDWDKAPSVNFEVPGKRGTITLANLRREAQGEPPKDAARRWSQLEDLALSGCSTLTQACKALPSRTAAGVAARAHKIGVVLGTKSWTPNIFAVPEATYVDLDAVEAMIPPSWPPDLRRAIKGEIAYLQLERFPGSLDDAFRLALTNHNKLFGVSRLSLDAAIPGRDGLRFIDMVANDDPHF